jgi:4a-hydroxytetrahydrobiopterin dehydratase
MSAAKDTATLSERELDRELSELPGWRREGATLVRELKLRDFEEALRFLERMGELANDYGRRPDMCVSEFNRVRLSVANLHHAGLTLAELRLAGKVNAAIRDHHPEAWEAS